MKLPQAFSLTVWEAAIAHAQKEFPNEACGLVVEDAYVPCTNVAADPLTDFEIGADMLARHPVYQGVIHSHPNGISAPSHADMAGQIDTEVPWGIVVLYPDSGAYATHFDWGDHLLDVPLIGRDWRPGVLDCFSMVRSHVWQAHQYHMNDIARSDDWSLLDTKLVFDANRPNYPAFTEVDFSPAVDLEEGDIILMALQADRPNHFSIYLGNNLILHHPPQGLSSRRPLNTLAAKIVHVLRFTGDPK